MLTDHHLQMRHIIHITLLLIASILPSCIEDGVITDPSAQPRFETDTLSLGSVFTGEGSPTASVKIYNPHDKILSISSVRLRNGQYFRINVDGFSGREFTDVEIRPNDSIYMFVEATPPHNGGEPLPVLIDDHIDMVTNGIVRTLVVEALGQDVDTRRGEILTSDTRFTAGLPYRIVDSLVVAPGVTLSVDPGTTIYFHDNAQLRIHGTLISEGTAQQPVTMRGDRQGTMAGKITYEIMPNQWHGMIFFPGSTGNRMTYTSVDNTAEGVSVNGSDLTLAACRIHNSGADLLTATDSEITAMATQLTNASGSVVSLTGGTTILNRCTVANYYLFAAPHGLLMDIRDSDRDDESAPASVNVTNSILTGRGGTLADKEFTGRDITFARCLFSVNGTNDDNFIDCLWDSDPLLDFDLENYTFDYSPAPDSPAIDAADPQLDRPELPLTDAHGNPIGLTIGAYGPATDAD